MIFGVGECPNSLTEYSTRIVPTNILGFSRVERFERAKSSTISTKPGHIVREASKYAEEVLGSSVPQSIHRDTKTSEIENLKEQESKLKLKIAMGNLPQKGAIE
jgi:hypothetical protein